MAVKGRSSLVHFFVSRDAGLRMEYARTEAAPVDDLRVLAVSRLHFVQSVLGAGLAVAVFAGGALAFVVRICVHWLLFDRSGAPGMSLWRPLRRELTVKVPTPDFSIRRSRRHLLSFLLHFERQSTPGTSFQWLLRRGMTAEISRPVSSICWGRRHLFRLCWGKSCNETKRSTLYTFPALVARENNNRSRGRGRAWHPIFRRRATAHARNAIPQPRRQGWQLTEDNHIGMVYLYNNCL